MRGKTVTHWEAGVGRPRDERSELRSQFCNNCVRPQEFEAFGTACAICGWGELRPRGGVGSRMRLIIHVQMRMRGCGGVRVIGLLNCQRGTVDGERRSQMGEGAYQRSSFIAN